MSNRLSDEKAQAIAIEYYNNGFQKVMALLSIGYSKTYANHIGLKLFDNDKVKLALKRLKDCAVVKTGFTIVQAQIMYEEDRIFAKSVNQAGAAVSATTGICRLYGMDQKDTGVGEDAPEPLTAKDLEVLRNMAKTLTESELDRPKITKLNTG